MRIEIVPGPSAARRRWAAAPLVLVGVDQTGEAARAGLPHRPEVAVVGRDLDDATVWQRGSAVGAAHVLILPDCERWLAGMLAEADSPREEPGVVVAVLSGRGGAGGSTLAAALALAGTRRGLRATLVDLDPAGGGIDLLFGLETERDRAGRSWRSGTAAVRPLAAGGAADLAAHSQRPGRRPGLHRGGAAGCRCSPGPGPGPARTTAPAGWGPGLLARPLVRQRDTGRSGERPTRGGDRNRLLSALMPADPRIPVRRRKRAPSRDIDDDLWSGGGRLAGREGNRRIAPHRTPHQC